MPKQSCWDQSQLCTLYFVMTKENKISTEYTHNVFILSTVYHKFKIQRIFIQKSYIFNSKTMSSRRACPGMSFQLKISPSHRGIWAPHLIHGSLSPQPKTAFQSVQPFVHSSCQSIVRHVGACPSPQNCPFPGGDLDPHPIHNSWSPPEPTTQTASRSVRPFLHSSWQCYMACPRMSFPIKIAPSYGDLDPHVIQAS